MANNDQSLEVWLIILDQGMMLHVIMRFLVLMIELLIVDAIRAAITNNELWGLACFMAFINLKRMNEGLHLALEVDEGRSAAWLLG